MAQYFFNLYEELKGELEGKELSFRGVIESPYLTVLHADSATRTAGDLAIIGEGLSVFRGADDTDSGLEDGFISAPEIVFKNEKSINGEIYVRLRVFGSDQTSPDNFTNNGPSFSFRKKGPNSEIDDCLLLQTGGITSYGITFERLLGVRESRLPSSLGWASTQPFRNPFKYINYRVKLDGKTWNYKDWAGDKESEPVNWNKTALDSGIINMEEGFISFFIPANKLLLSIVEIGIGTEQDSAPIYKVVNPPANNQYDIKGKITLEDNPHSTKVVIVAADNTAKLIDVVNSDPVTGDYQCITSYSKPVMIFTTQDYGLPWSAGTAKVIGDVVHPTTPNGYIYKVTQAGSTGQAEPIWTAEQNVSINDGSVIYQSERLLKPEIEGYVTPTPIA